MEVRARRVESWGEGEFIFCARLGEMRGLVNIVLTRVERSEDV